MATVSELINQAEESIQHLLYAKASAKFTEALRLSPNDAGHILKEKYHTAVQENEYETALSIGVALLGVEAIDGSFANVLGNMARMAKNKDQAYGLYKQSIKADPKNKYPLFNIAALLANSQRYDQHVIDAVQHFPESLNYVIPEYFIQDENGFFLCVPNYEKDIEAQVLTYKKFRERENSDTEENSDPILENSGLRYNVKNPTLTYEDYLEYFDKTALDNNASSLVSYNKAVYCMKHKKADGAELAISAVDPNFGYPAKYIDLFRAIFFTKQGLLEEAEGILHTLVGNEPYNRYFIVNLGLFLRNRKKTLQSIRYLLMGYEMLSVSGFKYELREYIVELNEKISAHGPGIAKVSLAVLYNQGVVDPLLFYNLGLAMVNEKFFVEAVMYFRKTDECDDEHLIKQSNIQIEKIRAYLSNEAEILFNGNRFKQANEMYYIAYRIQKDMEIIKKMLHVYEFYTPDPKDLEIKKMLKQDLKQFEEKQRAAKGTVKNEIRKENLEKARLQYIKTASLNISQKRYHNAIPLLESAFRINPDKATFGKLVAIYRALKKNDALVDLATRYKKIIDHDKKVKEFEKASNTNL